MIDAGPQSVQTCSTRGKRGFHLRAAYGMDQEFIDALKNQHWSIVYWSICGTCPATSRKLHSQRGFPTSRRIEKIERERNGR